MKDLLAIQEFRFSFQCSWLPFEHLGENPSDYHIFQRCLLAATGRFLRASLLILKCLAWKQKQNSLGKIILPLGKCYGEYNSHSGMWWPLTAYRRVSKQHLNVLILFLLSFQLLSSPLLWKQWMPQWKKWLLSCVLWNLIPSLKFPGPEIKFSLSKYSAFFW